MTTTIEISPEAEATLTERAAAAGLSISAYLQQMTETQALPRTMEELMARVTVAPGETNGMAEVYGQWPGDETDEEVLAALEELS